MPKRNPLVCQHLENVSRDLLEQHLEFIRQYVRGRQGVYALYRRSKIYYVEVAGNLRSHLAHHLNDRHHDSWDRFSVYITTDDNHLRELESLEPYAVAMEKTLTQRPQRRKDARVLKDFLGGLGHHLLVSASGQPLWSGVSPPSTLQCYLPTPWRAAKILLTQRPQRLALRTAENTFPLRPRREPLRPLR